jgi:hypothetical protein
MPGLRRLVPRVGLAVERELQPLHSARPPRASSSTRVFTWSRPTRSDVVHGALEVAAFLAIELQEGAGVLEHLACVFTLQRNCATSVLMPPLPAT